MKSAAFGLRFFVAGFLGPVRCSVAEGANEFLPQRASSTSQTATVISFETYAAQ
jgi:hypothetical protein